MVHFPKKEVTVKRNIRQFEGTEAVITGAHQTPITGTWQYNLGGCVSPYGLPYWFCDDWLVPIDESEVSEA